MKYTEHKNAPRDRYVPSEPKLASGKCLHNYRKSQFSIKKSTISMAIFNSYFDITRGYKPPFSLGKSTISMGIFQFAFCMVTRGERT
jgi:hypothetical protein